MPVNPSLSTLGFNELKKSESVVDGLYNDDSGYATFGVGHLVHYSPSTLLAAAGADPAWSKFIVVVPRPHNKPLVFFSRQAAFQPNFAAWVAKLASAGNRRDVLEEARLLPMFPLALYRQDLVPYESGVRNGVSVVLLQPEFDALVAFTFNVGVNGFLNSRLLTLINQAKYRAFDITAPPSLADRRLAIQAIERQFLSFNKSKNSVTGVLKVNPGLTIRRQRESDHFLAYARRDLAEQEAWARISNSSPNTCYEEPLMSWDNPDWELGQYGVGARGR